jgi:hypothetical protein
MLTTIGSVQKAWFLGITNASHENTHDIVPNPLAYSIYTHRQPEHAAAMQQAIALRGAQISHSQASRILDSQDLSLSKSAYYNILKPSVTSIGDGDLTAIWDTMVAEGFHTRSRYTYVMDSATGQPISRCLQQLFFISDAQIRLGERFCSSFMVEIDSTFNTNALRLLLTIIVGVSNTGMTFPLTFSFVPAENKVFMNFIFESLSELVWSEYPPLSVVIADQGPGLISSFSTSLPYCILRFCEWYAFKNVRKHLIEKGYTKDKRQQIQPLI